MVARSLAEKSLSLRSRGLASQDRDALEQLAREGRIELSEVDEREMALADADTEAAQVSLDSLLERVRMTHAGTGASDTIHSAAASRSRA